VENPHRKTLSGGKGLGGMEEFCSIGFDAENGFHHLEDQDRKMKNSPECFIIIE